MRRHTYRHAHSEPLKQSTAAPTGAIAVQASDEVGRFVPLETLGSGTFSVVKLAMHVGTGRNVALKILSKTKIQELGTKERVHREIGNLRLCAAHPHLVRLYDVVDTPKSTILAMEYVSGGELYDYMHPPNSTRARMLSDDEARVFFQQIMSGVEYMHYKNVVHRDLKLENILLDANYRTIKIVDFGLSSLVRDGEMMHTSCGSPHYAAPEVISGKPYDGPGVDVWSMGVILYALLCGALPFHEDSIRVQFEKIKSGTYNIPNHISKKARELIQSMLEVDTKQRTTTAAIRLHPWFIHNLPTYLCRSPDITEKQERKMVDSAVVDEVLKLYRAVQPQSGKVTRKMAEKAFAHEADGEVGEEAEAMRDLRCAYELILDDKHECQRSMEVTQTKRVSKLSSLFSIRSRLRAGCAQAFFTNGRKLEELVEE